MKMANEQKRTLVWMGFVLLIIGIAGIVNVAAGPPGSQPEEGYVMVHLTDSENGDSAILDVAWVAWVQDSEVGMPNEALDDWLFLVFKNHNYEYFDTLNTEEVVMRAIEMFMASEKFGERYTQVRLLRAVPVKFKKAQQVRWTKDQKMTT
jgi:hypothetical protein